MQILTQTRRFLPAIHISLRNRPQLLQSKKALRRLRTLSVFLAQLQAQNRYAVFSPRFIFIILVSEMSLHQLYGLHLALLDVSERLLKAYWYFFQNVVFVYDLFTETPQAQSGKRYEQRDSYRSAWLRWRYWRILRRASLSFTRVPYLRCMLA